MSTPAKTFYFLAAALSCSAVAGSLTAQFVFLLDPCPLCIGQRLLYLLAALVLLIGLTAPGFRTVASWVGIGCGTAAASIGVYQGWLASPEALTECGAPGPYETVLWWLAENVSYALFAPEASCADSAAHTLLGFSMPFWSVVSGCVLVVLLLVYVLTRLRSADV